MAAKKTKKGTCKMVFVQFELNRLGRFIRTAMKTAIPATIVLGLAGCGGDTIDAVKNEYIDSQKTTTLGQILDNRRLCDSVKWQSSTDSMDRDIVEYTCFIKGVNDVQEAHRAESIKHSQESREYSIASDTKLLKEAESEASRISLNSAAIKKELLNNYLSSNEEPKNTTEHLETLRHAASRAADIKNNYSDDALIGLLAGEVFSRAIDNSRNSDVESLDNDLKDAMGTVFVQAQYVNPQAPVAEQQQYKADNIYPILRLPRDNLDAIEAYINDNIAEEQAMINSELERYKTDIEYQAAAISSQVDSQLQHYTSEVERLKAQISKTAESAATIEDEALEKYPDYDAAYEKIQWIVNKELIPSFVSTEVVAVLSSNQEEKTLMKSSSSKVYTAIVVAQNSEHDYTFENYVGALRAVGLAEFLNYEG